MSTFLKYWYVWLILIIIIGFYIGTKNKTTVITIPANGQNLRPISKYECFNGWQYISVYGNLSPTGKRC